MSRHIIGAHSVLVGLVSMTVLQFYTTFKCRVVGVLLSLDEALKNFSCFYSKGNGFRTSFDLLTLNGHHGQSTLDTKTKKCLYSRGYFEKFPAYLFSSPTGSIGQGSVRKLSSLNPVNSC